MSLCIGVLLSECQLTQVGGSVLEGGGAFGRPQWMKWVTGEWALRPHSLAPLLVCSLLLDCRYYVTSPLT